MHVKRLYRTTVRDALTAAREELGPGALVLSTEFVPAPGWRGWIGQRVVRLTAAAERPETPVEVSADRPEAPVRRQSQLTGVQAGVVARLQAAGFDPALAEAVAQRMTPGECRGGSEAAILRALAAELQAVPAAADAPMRYEVFVGPPGVGKTTTVAKLAAQAQAQAHKAGGASVRLISADAFRPGAVEQLRCYAGVIGVPFRVARSADELDHALTAGRQTALVDTAGRSPKDPSVVELFDVLADRRGVRTHLVLPADTAPSTAKRVLDRYAAIKPSCVVLTRLDEAESALPLFNAVRERGLPISYLAAGQRVPDDLWRATPATIAAALLHDPAPEAQPCH
jgi:flagellar biosynthesis protein FlhF